MLNFKPISLAEAKLDSTGTGVLEFNLSKPTLASLEINGKYRQVYLAPGHNLQVSINGSGP